MTNTSIEDKEYNILMKKVYRVINKADNIGYEFSDLECSIISRIAKAGSMNYVFAEFYHPFNHIYRNVMKCK